MNESVLVRWMNPEPVTECSESEKQTYVCIYMDSKKMILSAGKDWRYRCGEWACRHSVGGSKWENEEVASAYGHYRVSDGKLVRSCCVAREPCLAL